VHLLAVGRVKGIGVQALRGLIDTFDGDLARVWREDTPTVGDVLARARVKEPRNVATEIANRRDELLAQAERERGALAAEQVRVLGMHQPAFPRRLAELPDGSYWLFVQGDPAALNAAAHAGEPQQRR
jgi:predicted Rossmann fold nucleotide-binding protein DprA/Smf involved in DNA uptake